MRLSLLFQGCGFSKRLPIGVPAEKDAFVDAADEGRDEGLAGGFFGKRQAEFVGEEIEVGGGHCLQTGAGGARRRFAPELNQFLEDGAGLFGRK